MDQLINDMILNLTINDKSTGRLAVSLGTKGSGKTHFMNLWLKYCFNHNLYDMYFLILPSYNIEADGSYKFIDKNDPNIFIFEEYKPIISEKIMRLQKKLTNAKKDKKRIFFVIDDSSGEKLDSFSMDTSMKRLVTSIRHFNCVLLLIAHGSSGVLSTFLRQNCDVLMLYNLSNQALLENIFIEFLSLNKQYRVQDTVRKNMNEFINQFLTLHEKPYRCLYINLRTRNVFNEMFEVCQILQKNYQ